MIYLLILGLLVVIAAFFISRSLSPIPYFPSNKKDLTGIVKALQLVNDQVVYDLGAGDGVVILAASESAQRKKLNTKFVAVEINPVLLIILWLRRLVNPNRKNIQILYGDIFSIRYKLQAIRSKKVVFFAYISPWYLERAYTNIARQIATFRLVTYFYPMPKRRSYRTIKGVNSTYVYNT